MSVGGGPAGLYAAILLKRAEPQHRITVLERNASDDTFGFGVVFSAATLAELDAADPESHERLWDACARWDPVEVRYGGERIRAHGNQFAAISRHQLLRILQERALELGVDVRFETEVDDVDDLLGADLVLGADGLNSLVRRRFADAFEPNLTVEGSKYIWLGTTQRFDAFTFIFEETSHGLFQAHIYPFSEELSTFIVECSRDTWRAAGLDAVDAASLPPGVSDKDSIAFLDELFASHLNGHELVANNSKWLDWTTVRNRTWRHRNVVLLGDAAHTAHFSIGSGTKLAMEDSIALADAAERRDSLDAALQDYESARKPSADGIQQAAAESLDWFDRYHRYWGLEAPQFAYSLLTRSTRVNYDNLRRRDPALVDNLDRWYARRALQERGEGLLAAPPPALTPVEVGPVRLHNRIALIAPIEVAADDGLASTTYLDRVRRLGAAGAALVHVDGVAVSATGRVTPGDPGLYTDAHVERWADLVGQWQRTETDALLGIRLRHSGPRGATRPRDVGIDVPLPHARTWPLLAASVQRYSAASQEPRAATADDLTALCEEHTTAARRAANAGFDALELDFSHGYLVASFLSPLTNDRDDDYGGDLAGRLRLALELLGAVRDVWPADRLLSVSFSASDLERGGTTPADAVEIGRQLIDAGADLLHVVAGQTTPRSRPDFRIGFNATWSDVVRNQAGVPTSVSGNLPRMSDANHVLLGGQADLCVLGRPLLDTPDWLS